MFKENHNLATFVLQVCMGTGLDNLRHNMESIRNTMQMQEDVFKHQVRELHRLYSVQKILMDELKTEIKKNMFWTTTSSDMNRSQFINQHQITAQTTSGLNLHVQGDTRASGFDLERPSGEEAATVDVVAEDQAGPSSRTGQMMSIEGSDEDSEVELTLSIGIGGSGSSKKKPKNSSTSSQSIHNKEITRELDSSASCSGPGTPVSSSSATFDQENKLPPHWLFQGFSINRT